MNKTSHAIVRTLLLGTSCLSVAGLVVGNAIAQPTGGQVVYGGATITERGPNNTVIDQKTGKAIINWNSFSIGAGGTVKFNQPNANSIALNRVLGGEGSSIYGNLLANGQVWIINQNGILFGKGSTINVGGLIATTRDVSDTNFAAGNYAFSGDTGASVINQGTIRTRNGGNVVLSGASVQNQGLVQADTGTVVLGGASAFTVDFTGDGLLKYAITQPTGAADNGRTGVTNSGTLKAAGGRVIMTARAAANVQDAVVNNTGMISATSAKLHNGEVVLDAGDGDVNAGGTIDASGAGRGQTGGFVSITGHNVTVADNTNINVSGDAGGGTVLVGGDVHGQGTTPTAANTHVGHATINADATRTGNGGTLVVWSNGITDFSGLFSAKGGALSGNGGFLETSGQHLSVSPDAKVDTTVAKGQTGTWLLDPDAIVITLGEGGGAALDGNGKLALGTDPGQTDFIAPTTITNALATTNVTLEAARYIEVDADVIYGSSHSLSLMSEGNMYVFASIQNTQAAGGGAINLVAGWDGVTAPGAILSTPGSYGADDGENGRGDISFDGSLGNVFVGSASGTTTVAGLAAVLASNEGGNVQIGYHGAGGGNINVFMKGDLGLIASSPSDTTPFYSMIGNGALNGSVNGAVTGDINVQIGGTLILATGFTSCDCNNDSQNGPAPFSNGVPPTIGIGNAGGDTTPKGNVVLIGSATDDSSDENGGFGAIIFRDLGYADVTIGRLDTESPFEIGGASFNTSHNLTLMSAGDILVDGTLQNDGTGGITMVAGWDGIYNPAHIGQAGTYGNNNGTITVGGSDAGGDVSVGTASGALTLYGANLSVHAANGNAQLGYHGAGGGNIFVTMTGSVTLQGGGDSETVANAQIGNGSLLGDVTGNITGNISLNTQSFQSFDGDNGDAWLGNVAGTGSAETGDVQLLTRFGFFSGDYVVSDLQGGNVFIGFTDPTVTPLYIGGLHYNAPHDFTFAGGGSMNVTGGVQNAGAGAVTLVAGWDGHTVGTAAQLQAANAFGLNGATIDLGGGTQFEAADVGSAHGLTNILTGNLVVAPQAGFHAQIGYHGAGGGDIHVVALNGLTIAGGAAAADYAMIGNGSLNGDVTGAVTGNIDIHVGTATNLTLAGSANNAWIGNLSTATGNTGNTLVVTGTFNDDGNAAPMLVSGLNNGDVTVALTDASQPGGIDEDILYNSAHSLNLLFAGSAFILSNIQNAGSGAINLLGGWDGHTLDVAHFLDAGVYGNNGGSITIGGANAAASTSIGSAGGPTTVAASNVSIQSVNGSAQIGHHGNGGGNINVVALNAVSLNATGTNYLSQIGNLATTAGGTATGNVTVTAASLSVVANGTNATATVGGIATSNGSETGNVTINTHGGALAVSATGSQSHAHIGNWTRGDTTGTSTGTITIDSGALTLASASGGYTQIGNGAFRFGADSGAVGGNITIHATSFAAGATGSSQTRLGNLGVGSVSGDILVATTGSHTSAANGGLISVGNVFGGTDANSLPLQGVATGNLTIQSGGVVTLSAVNGGTSRIETGGAASGTVSVTAAGDVSLNAGTSNGTDTGTVLIGTLVSGNGATNVSVTSSGGSVRLNSNTAGSAAQIGNLQNADLPGTMSGTVSVSAANGNVFLSSAGATAAALIGNIGHNGITLGGNVTVLAGQAIGLSGAGAALGEIDQNSGSAASITGNVSLTANAITSLNTTLPITGNALTIVQTGAASSIGTSTNALAFKAGTLNLTGTGSNFFLASQGAVAISGAALATGVLNMTSAGAITQTGAIAAARLLLTTTSGAIALTSTANAVSGQSVFNTPGSVTFYNTLTTSIGASSIGGDLTLLSKNNINIQGNIQLNAGAITLLAGWDGTTTNAANFANSGVYGNGTGGVVAIGGNGATGSVALGSKTGTTTLYGRIVALNAFNGNAQLGYHGTGGGAIVVRATSDVNVNASGSNPAFGAMIGNGSLTTDVTGNITGDIDLRAGGNLNFTGTNVQFGNLAHSGTETGNVILIASDTNGADNQFGGFIQNALNGGDVTLGYTGTGDQGPENNFSATSSHNLTLLSAGNLVMAGGIQNAGTGAITLVAGWDGHTLSGFGNAGVAGNNGKGVTIGGSTAAGNVAVGSAGGQTSVYGASLAITAVNGYAQLGFNGHGTGAILVNVSGALTMAGGAGAGQFAQLGNGGLKTSGNNSGDINVKAGGAVTLTSGAGTEAYVQLGHGGAESNTAAQQGYSNQGAITVAGQDVILNAGTGQAAYVQIGHGGYKVGAGITGGTATNSGAITITSAHTVAFNGNTSASAGADAYMQIGNGGSQSNLNPAAAAGGTDGGDIIVTAPNGAAGSVTLTAGLGANSYAMIGNGGYSANAGATSTVANWTISGNISVTDLVLTGGQGTGNEFSVIGNGDASKNSTGNVSGNITISANGQITYNNGKAPTSLATIGNFTGTGTTSGTLTGAQPPSQVTTDPVIIGITTTNTADTNPNNGNNNITTINTTVVPATQDTSGGATNVPPPSASTTPGALASMDNGGDSSEPNTSDSATTLVADSLDGAKKAGSTTLLAGMLKQTTPTTSSNTVHGVPPADQDFSSWGNEALWQ